MLSLEGRKMISLRDKKASHVGMILSFVIFVTFVIFLYTVTEPATRIERGKQDLLQYLEIELINELSSDMTTATVNIDNSIAESCVRFGVVPGTEDMNIVVKTEQDILEHKKSDAGPNTFVVIDRKSNDFFKVFYSDDFNDASVETPCSNPITLNENTGYSLGLVRTTNHIFESRIKNMVENFDEDYMEIKNSFNVAPGNEFGFIFQDAYENITGTAEKNTSANIYVEEIPIQYVDEEANIKSGFLRIRVW